MKRMICLALALVMLLTSAALAENTITVSGGAVVNVAADVAYVRLGVYLNDADVTTAMQLANERIDAICAVLSENGIDEKCISTDYLYISPMYDYSDDGNGEITGYSVNNGLLIEISDVDSVGNIIDVAFAAGANNFDSVTFSLKNKSEARDEALRLAVEEAAHKAEVLAEASGKQLGNVISISESDDTYYSTDSYAESAVSTDKATTVRASQASVSAQVSICYELEDIA